LSSRAVRPLVLRGGVDKDDSMQDAGVGEYGDKGGHTAEGWWNATDFFFGFSKSSTRSLLIEAIRSGNLQDIETFARRGIDMNEIAPDLAYEQTFVHLAARCGNLACLQLMLKLGGNVSAVDNFLNTPLHIAAVHGHLELVLLLIANGANVSVANKQGLQPIHMAASNGHVDTLQTLIVMGADVTSPTSSGSIPVRWSSVNGHVEATRLLLESWKLRNKTEHDVNPCHYKDRTNKTVLEVVHSLHRRNREKNVLNRRMEQILAMLESFAINEQLPPQPEDEILKKENANNFSSTNTTHDIPSLSPRQARSRKAKYTFYSSVLLDEQLNESSSSESALTSGSSVSSFHHNECGNHKDPKMFMDDSEMNRRYPSKVNLILDEKAEERLEQIIQETMQEKAKIDKEWEERVAQGHPRSARTVEELEPMPEEVMDDIVNYPTLSEISQEMKKEEYKEYIEAYHQRFEKGTMEDLGVDPVHALPVNPECFTIHDLCISRMIGDRNYTTYPYEVYNGSISQSSESSSSTPIDSDDEWGGLKKEKKEAKKVEKEILETYGKKDEREDYNILHRILESEEDMEERRRQGDEDSLKFDEVSSPSSSSL